MSMLSPTKAFSKNSCIATCSNTASATGIDAATISC
jgi:hypothetical protein